LERHIRIIKIRALASIALYGAFVLVGFVFAFRGLSAHQPTPLVALLLSAYFLLPRRTLPRGYKPQDSDDPVTMAVLDDWRKKFIWARMVYFAVAIVILVVLPNVF
jgi:hypothetical protein